MRVKGQESEQGCTPSAGRTDRRGGRSGAAVASVAATLTVWRANRAVC